MEKSRKEKLAEYLKQKKELKMKKIEPPKPAPTYPHQNKPKSDIPTRTHLRQQFMKETRLKLMQKKTDSEKSTLPNRTSPNLLQQKKILATRRNNVKNLQKPPINPTYHKKVDHVKKASANLPKASAPPTVQVTKKDLLAHIDEALYLAKISESGAREKFRSMDLLPEFSQVKSTAMFWAARAKFEEDLQESCKENVEVVFNKAWQFVLDPNEKRILKACHSDYTKRCKPDVSTISTDKTLANEIPKNNIESTEVKELAKRLSFSSIYSSAGPLSIKKRVDMFPVDKDTTSSELILSPQTTEPLMCNKKSTLSVPKSDLSKYLFDDSSSEEEDMGFNNNTEMKKGSDIAIESVLSKSSAVSPILSSSKKNTPISSNKKIFSLSGSALRVPIASPSRVGKETNPKKLSSSDVGGSTIVLAECRSSNGNKSTENSIHDELSMNDVTATPVRRSLRHLHKESNRCNLEILERTSYNYTPNSALNQFSSNNGSVAIRDDKENNPREEIQCEGSDDLIQEVSLPNFVLDSAEKSNANHVLGSAYSQEVLLKSGVKTPVRRSKRLTKTPRALREELAKLNT